MSAESSSPIFLLGLHESGASLVGRALASHPELTTVQPAVAVAGRRRGPPAKEGILDPGSGLDALAQKLQLGPHADCFAHPAYLSRYRLTEADVKPGDGGELSAAFLAAMIEPARRLSSMLPINTVRSRYLYALFPDARFVAIVRDPYANVSANTLRRNRWGAIEEQALHWSEAHDCLLADRSKLQHCLLVHYEELVADPTGTMEKIARYCLITFIPTLLEQAGAQADSNDRLTALLDKHDRTIITKVCKQTMRKLGYSVLDPAGADAATRSRPAA